MGQAGAHLQADQAHQVMDYPAPVKAILEYGLGFIWKSREELENSPLRSSPMVKAIAAEGVPV